MLSVVIPLYNEEVLVEKLMTTTFETLNSLYTDFEVIAVDDGSTDGTLFQLKTIQRSHLQLKILVLSRNFGHQAAYTAGLTYAKGDYVAMMDGDFQDPPEILASFYKKIEQPEIDLVVGKRIDRDVKKPKGFSTKLFHWIFRRSPELDNMVDSGNFCMMSRQVTNALLSMKERVRYLPGLRNFVGFNVEYVDYERENRDSGQSKMSYSKLVKLGFDALFSFSNWPIRLCLWLGLLGILTVIFAVFHILLSKIFGWAPIGWSSTYLSIFFFGAVQLTFLGVIGEYVYRIYKEIQKRPTYFVKEVIE